MRPITLAALRVAGVATFTPALNLDKVVPVWTRNQDAS